jgi:hypothetical protein
LGEDFFKARITEVRYETIAKEEKEHIVEKKIDAILPLEGEVASLKAEGSLNANEYIGFEEVVGGGEAIKVGEDESNIVISLLKDGGGISDDSIDEINLVLIKEVMIKMLEGRDVFGESFVVCLKLVYIEKSRGAAKDG